MVFFTKASTVIICIVCGAFVQQQLSNTDIHLHMLTHKPVSIPTFLQFSKIWIYLYFLIKIPQLFIFYCYNIWFSSQSSSGSCDRKTTTKREMLLCIRTTRYQKFPLILNHHRYYDIGMLAFASRKPLSILVVKRNEKQTSLCMFKIFFYWILDDC